MRNSRCQSLQKKVIQPTANYSNSQPTVYEATTIISANDLKMELKQRVAVELTKIEQHIYQLERQAREYKKLIVAMDNMDY